MPNKEIERKWLVNGVPEGYIPRKTRLVEQSYLYVGKEAELRIYRRQKVVKTLSGEMLAPPKFFITVKIGNGLERKEYEAPISEEKYNELMQDITAQPIQKVWYTYPLNCGLTLDVMQVDDSWWYAEIEFPTREAAEQFEVFDYLKDAVEVTGDPMYAMKHYWARTREI